MNRLIPALLVSAAVLLPPAAASPTRDKADILSAKSTLQEGVNTWDGGKLNEARDLFLGLLNRDTDHETALQYFIVICDYRLAAHAMIGSDTETVGRCTTEAMQYLEKIMLTRPDWGEPYALYASMLGYEIVLHMDRAMELAFKINDYFGKANARGPDDPRVNMMQGISVFYTPAMYGGGADKAIPLLERAVKNFQQEKPLDPYSPSWGMEEACTYLGMAYNQQERPDRAAACFEKALARNPDFGLARDELGKLKKP